MTNLFKMQSATYFLVFSALLAVVIKLTHQHRILTWLCACAFWVSWKGCVRAFAPELEHVCGRPLGLRFDKKTGDPYIADAYFGLMVVGPSGGLAALVANEAEGEPFRLTNDLDIDESEDVIYFTDSSTTFHRSLFSVMSIDASRSYLSLRIGVSRQFLNACLSGDKTGRLMKYDKSSKGGKFLLRGLAFANGGPDAGKLDTFAELPGFPDNIRRNSRGEFGVALHTKKGPVARFLLSNSLIGNFALRLPISFQQLHSLFVGGKADATAVKLGKEGEILEVVEDTEGKTVQFISEVEERGNKLWIASVMRPFIAIYDLDQTTHSLEL
ncbi:Str_synth domain-containing protein [Psidium guajava]|nr:Str_synth domain-containing protein [Psidium guajava]